MVLGSHEAIGNGYWDAINFVSAAYWRCDAPEAIDNKARNVMTRLSEATSQLSEHVPGIVHIGIETADGDDVEHIRQEKVANAIAAFDPRGRALAWVYLHYFRGDSPPDELWAIDETTQRFSGIGGEPPLRTDLLLGDGSVPVYHRAHWDVPRACR